MNLTEAIQALSGSPYVARRDAAIQTAQNHGMDVVEANDNLLLLDIDSESDLHFAYYMLGQFGKQLDVDSSTVTRSKSGRWHVHVKLRTPINRRDRVLLQACLGSDRKHEILHFIQDAGEPLFFELRHAKHEPFTGAA